MPRDSEATRSRILDAAVEEFAAHGLAGARIDRIAVSAKANKRSIYVYYESKEGLFTAALQRVIAELNAEVPLTEHDLPGYAGRFFDYLVAHPHTLRLSMWRHLERPDLSLSPKELYAEKIAAMKTDAVAEASGLPPTDLIVLVIGLATVWLWSPEDLLGADGGEPWSAGRLAEHRSALVEAAGRLAAPVGSG